MKDENKILAIIVLGIVMGALDTTIIILALPDITKALGATLSLSIWTILVYLFIVAVATTQLGRLGDILGRSKMFNAGFAVFTIGSALCGLAPDILFLIAARAVQAIGGSLLEANSGAIVADTFEKSRRGRAFGFTGIGWNVGAVLGIVLGGIITTFAGWRFIFWLNVPIGIAAFIAGWHYLPKDNPAPRQSFDLVGMLLLAASLGLLALGLVDFAGMGANADNAILLAAGAALLPVFFWWESRQKQPMLDVAAFKKGVLRSSLLAAFFQALGYLSVSFVMTLYLQGLRGLDPLDAALLLLPGYLVSAVLSPKMGSLSDRYGARVIATIGIGLMATTVLIYLSLGVDTPLYEIVIASLFAGVGASMFWPANVSAVMAAAVQDRHGSTSGLLRTLSNLGTLGSYVLAITAASIAIPRQVAFGIFLGNSNLVGNLPEAFLGGLKAALFLSLIMLLIAGWLSATRGKEERQHAIA